MYFITCFSKCDKDEHGRFDGGDIRTFGYYEDFETCKLAMGENWCDMHEYLYGFAVVEKIEQGIHPKAEETAWFKWDDERNGFFEIKKPDCTYGVCNYAFG